MKKNPLEFDIKTVNKRLDVLGDARYYNVSLEDDLKFQTFPRQFFSSQYGGNGVATFPTIAKEFLDIHGLDDWMFPNLQWNPHGPEIPGYAGLFFEVEGVINPRNDSDSVYRVIVRLHKGPQWQYVGQYVLINVPSLTSDEWKAQSLQVIYLFP
jgi:hypothetical protein